MIYEQRHYDTQIQEKMGASKMTKEVVKLSAVLDRHHSNGVKTLCQRGQKQLRAKCALEGVYKGAKTCLENI